MNPEIRARKKEKRSIERKKRALRIYEEAIKETHGPTVSWVDWPKGRRNPERMREGLSKGINELRRELESVKC